MEKCIVVNDDYELNGLFIEHIVTALYSVCHPQHNFYASFYTSQIKEFQ